MLQTLKKRYEAAKEEDGFTLIELAVVILIIGILLAIAIPTFLGVRSRAQNKSAQSSLRNTLVDAKAVYSDTGNYSGVTTASLLAAEPSLSFPGGVASTGPKVIAFAVSTSAGGATDDTFMAWAKSDSGNCYAIMDVGGKTTFGQPASCAAVPALADVALAQW